MRVLVLSRRGIAGAKTGDSTQMRRTIECLRPLVSSITQVFVDNNGSLYDAEDRPFPESLDTLCRMHDVAHQLPRLNFRAHRCVADVLDALPCAVSTVFWHDSARVRIAWRSETGLRKRLLAAVRAVRAGSRRLHDYRKACDVLLPNSWAEGENVRAHFQLRAGVSVLPVPNAVEKPNFDLDELPRPPEVPAVDYMVVPAAFATRKNQLGLIRAFRNTTLPIVMMGDPVANARDYWARCRRAATDNMVFLPHRNNREPGYWAVLRHARCACLASDCETPGIALLEAALAGARPVVTRCGGTQEYFGVSGGYFDPIDQDSLRLAVAQAWARGRLSPQESRSFLRFTWEWAAEMTLNAYQLALHGKPFSSQKKQPSICFEKPV